MATVSQVLHLVGMDWATKPGKRALVALDVQTDFATCRVVSVLDRISDAAAVAACSNSDLAIVAVDTPFGWPRQFAQFASTWRASTGTQAPPKSDEFRFRLTDRVVRDEVPKSPLSVSADRLAMGARAWAALIAREAFGDRIDVLGVVRGKAPTLIEVYPGASAIAFGEPTTASPKKPPSYKPSETARRQLVEHVVSLFGIDAAGYLDVLVGKGARSDATDAFLAVVTAAIYLAERSGATLAQSGWRVRSPHSAEEKELAVSEGWIFFPLRPP